MNETVKRIVEILFQDTEVTEEVQAMRDELMDNGQQRYEDLVAQGRSEDEAIALVVESLKGMEEVIGAYPRSRSAASHAQETDEDGRELYFPAAQVKRVDVVNLLSQDIALVPGQGDQVVVHLKGKEGIHLNARLAGETLWSTLPGRMKTRERVHDGGDGYGSFPGGKRWRWSFRLPAAPG